MDWERHERHSHTLLSNIAGGARRGARVRLARLDSAAASDGPARRRPRIRGCGSALRALGSRRRLSVRMSVATTEAATAAVGPSVLNTLYMCVFSLFLSVALVTILLRGVDAAVGGCGDGD